MLCRCRGQKPAETHRRVHEVPDAPLEHLCRILPCKDGVGAALPHAGPRVKYRLGRWRVALEDLPGPQPPDLGLLPPLAQQELVRLQVVLFYQLAAICAIGCTRGPLEVLSTRTRGRKEREGRRGPCAARSSSLTPSFIVTKEWKPINCTDIVAFLTVKGRVVLAPSA